MSELTFKGPARVVGDDVNTDYIISSRRKRDTLDEKELARYLMEDVDPHFAATVHPGDILVAGSNFGCGSAMEIAALVVKGAGIRAVIAKSFARTFYRNGINNGLLLGVCDTSAIQNGDLVELSVKNDCIYMTDHVRGTVLEAGSIPQELMDIVTSGGLVAYSNLHRKA